MVAWPATDWLWFSMRRASSDNRDALTVTGMRPAAAARRLWAIRRRSMEVSGLRYTTRGTRRRSRNRLYRGAKALLTLLLWATGTYARGHRNARRVVPRRIELHFPHLPPAFNGFRILQLSDLHVDAYPGLADAAIGAVSALEADICILTGDFRTDETAPHGATLDEISRLMNSISSRHGTFAVLGNHDGHAFGQALEARLGLRLLVNEAVTFERHGQRIRLAGVDDVNCFYTAEAEQLLRQESGDFGIALVHSPELAEAARDGGYALYLCGHTHGGQVCLPGGVPVVTHLVRGRRRARGLWRLGSLTGYTSSGVGVAQPPVRFFSQSEVVLFTLRHAPPT